MNKVVMNLIEQNLKFTVAGVMRNPFQRLKVVLVWALLLSLVWNPAMTVIAREKVTRLRAALPVSKATRATAMQSGSTIIWGPQDVVRQPINTTYTANFSLPAGALAPYTMTVSNGAPDGTRKVTSACVRINGTAVLSPTCNHTLNPSPQVRTVSLLADNTITVTLVGPSLSYITITITGSAASLAASPTSATQGQSLAVTMTGSGSNWAAGQTVANFGGEVTVNSLTVNSATSATAQITVSPTAALGPRTITMTTGSEIINAVDAFTVNAASPPGAASATVSTLAGTAGTPGFVDGTGAAARFRQLAGLAAAPNEVVYVADAGNHAIRRVDAAGAVTTTAGNSSPGFVDAQGTSAQFNNPQGVAIDAQGNLYVADTGNHSIRRIDTSGTVTTLAGDGTSGFVNGNGAAARFNAPRGIAVDTLGRIYVADTGNHAVRRIDSLGNVTTIAGDGTAGSSNTAPVRFNGLAGIAADGTEIYLYIADGNNHRIRRLDNNNTVITLAGLDRGFKDGTAAESRFADPTGIAVDGAGHVIVADSTNSLIREIDPVRAINGESAAVFTIAGTGARGAANGAGNAASFNKPAGAAVLASGAVIVADTANQTLRKVLLPPTIASISPAQGAAGSSVTITGTRFDGRGTTFNTVQFTAAGGGAVAATVNSATRTQLAVTVPATAATGSVTVQTAGGTSNAIGFTVPVTAPPSIADFNPKTGPVGTLVTITGSNLKIGAADPAVTFAGSGGTRLPAFIAFSSPSEVRATVPNAAVTGVIQLTTSAGVATTAQSFTVAGTQDFVLTLAPSTTTVVQGSTATYTVSVTSPQTTFTQFVSLSAINLPSGVVATFSPQQISAQSKSTLSLRLTSATSTGTSSFNVQGVANIDGSDTTRSVGASFTVTAAGQTTLAGRVLSTELDPIMGATVSLDGRTATTDASGSFLLIGVNAGIDRPLMVDGRTASAPNRPYPVIVEPATIISGTANVVPYTFYLPAIDTQYEVTVIPNQTTTVTNPRVPNLTMTIPPNANLRNRDGSPVSRVSITPVPIDRTPAPLPADLATSLVYTSQPGGAIVDPGIKMPVTYPNLGGADPGSSIRLFAFNHDTAQWYQYGTGHVTDDGKLIVPDPGVGLPDFSWHFPELDPNVPWYDCLNRLFFPVQLSSGAKMEMATDIAFGGERGGILFSRIYTNDQAVGARTTPLAFGQWTHNYDFRITGSVLTGGLAGRMSMPDQAKGPLFSYQGSDSSGTRIYTTTGTPGQLGDYLFRKSDASLEYRTAQGGRMIFNSSGRLTSIINNNNNTISLTYTGNNLTRISDDVGRAITLAYTANNRVQSITDPLNRVTTYSYNGSGFLESVTNPMSGTTTYSIGQFTGRLDAITDPRGNRVKLINYYRPEDGINDGRVKSEVFADGGTLNFSYSYAGRVVAGVTVTDQVGRSESRRFDSRGLTIETVDGLGQATKIQRDISTNLPISAIGSCGCTEGTFTYNNLGFVTSATNRLNYVARAEYSATLNRIERVTDELGRVSTVSYDTRGNLTSFTNPLNQTTSFTYDILGQLTRVTDPLGHERNYEYDLRGNRTAIIDSLGNRSTMEYDLIGRVTAMTDPLGRRISVSYDNLDRILTITDSNAATTTYTYDANGNRTRVRDQIGREWLAAYDGKNQLISVTDPLGRTVRLAYNLAGEVTRMTSPSGRTMRYAYDSRGQVKSFTDPLGATVRWEYDYRGNPTVVRDERGHATTFEYDELNRPTKVRDPLGRSSTVEYNAVGNIIRMRDRLGRQIDISYDNLNRPSVINYPDATVSYTYDAAGRTTRIDDSQGGFIAWAYDDADRLISETSPAGTVTYTYNSASQVSSMTAADRQPVSYGYDNAGRLQSITQGQSSFIYSYDVISRMSGLSRPNGITTTYSYDLVDRLQRLEHKNVAGNAFEDYQYAYNIDDELTAITTLSPYSRIPNTKAVGAADAANRITQFGAVSYAYDVEGQTTSRSDSSGTTNFQWDTRGRLKQAVLGTGQTIEYGYDAIGRRTSRTTNGLTTSFLYDGADVVLDRAGTATTEYLNGLGVDEKLRQSSAAGDYYFLRDHLGSTALLTTPSGAVLEQLRYEPFGAGGFSSNTRYGFTGREHDDQTGLIYFRARWYDPQQGRFLSEDPVGFEGGLNLYGYVGNSPLMHSDPSGEAWWIPVAAAAGRGAANIGSSMLIATALGQCYGWRDVLVDFFFMGAGKGLKQLKRLMQQGGHFDDFLRFGGGGLRHLGGLGSRFGGSVDDLGRQIGKGVDEIVPSYRGHSGTQKAYDRIMHAFENGIQPRGGSEAPQTLDNLLESINSGSANSGWVQSSESFKIAEEFATRFGDRGGAIFEIAPRADSLYVNGSSIGNAIKYPEQQIVAHPGGIDAGQIIRAHIVDKFGKILKTFENPLYRK